MTDRDDIHLQALFREATPPLPDTDFSSSIMRQLERQERVGRALAIAQRMALLGLLLLLAPFVENQLSGWASAAASARLFSQSAWWSAVLVVGTALLLLPPLARRA